MIILRARGLRFADRVGLPVRLLQRAPATWVPLLILTQTIFLTGLGFFISALNVFFRDTSVLVEVGLSAWFFLTPIIYDARDVAHDLANWMYYLNPMASLVANFREVFYYNDGASPDPFFMLRNSNSLYCATDRWISVLHAPQPQLWRGDLDVWRTVRKSRPRAAATRLHENGRD